MEKLLIDSQGDYIVYDLTTNTVKGDHTHLSKNELYFQNFYVAKDDGQVITNMEVIDYNKGDIILIFSYYKSNTLIPKILVCSDPSAADDYNRILEECANKGSE